MRWGLKRRSWSVPLNLRNPPFLSCLPNLSRPVLTTLLAFPYLIVSYVTRQTRQVPGNYHPHPPPPRFFSLSAAPPTHPDLTESPAAHLPRPYSPRPSRSDEPPRRPRPRRSLSHSDNISLAVPSRAPLPLAVVPVLRPALQAPPRHRLLRSSCSGLPHGENVIEEYWDRTGAGVGVAQHAMGS